VYNSEEDGSEISEGVTHITKGHSKDNAPELNQVVLQLLCTHKSGIPLWIEALSGNTSDKKSFTRTVKEFQKQFDRERMPYMVMNSAFYTRENLISSGDFMWVTRVPETVQWYIDGTLRDDDTAIEKTKKRKGMFVVARQMCGKKV